MTNSADRRLRNKRYLAFALIETLVAISLLAIVVATIGPTFRTASVSTKGAAIQLAAALTEARQQAITQQVPVALVIPSDRGRQGQADSFYIASGEQPRVTQVRRLGDGRQVDLRIMVGHWPLDTSKLTNPRLTTTVTPPPESTWDNNFDIKQWVLPQSKDYAFVFTPRGKLVSNGLPHFDGAYHIIVSHGGRSRAASAPGSSGLPSSMRPNLFTPTQVGTPYTISLDPGGAVWVSPGVAGAPDGASYIREQAEAANAPAPPALSAPPSTAPVVRSVKLLPDPSKVDRPSGVDILLAPGRHMTMTVRAQSPEGVPLFCEWKANGGGISSPAQIRSTYLSASREWESVWQWRFPVDAKPGEVFDLKGVVKDEFGNEAPIGLGASAAPFVVQVGDPSVKVAYRNRFYRTCSINGDGTGYREVTKSPYVEYEPQWSPDGQRLLFARSDSPTGGNLDIYTVNADGTGEIRMTTSLGPMFHNQEPQWSPDGTQIAFLSARDIGGGRSQLYVMNADGSNQRRITNHTPRGVGNFTWSPDSRRLAYFHDGNIHRVNSDGSGYVQLTTTGGINSGQPRNERPSWSPDGGKIAFTSTRDGNGEFYSMDEDGSNQTNLTNNSAHEGGDPVWSPDGRQIIFHSSRGGLSQSELFIMDRDGSNQRNWSNNVRRDEQPAWAPDSNRVVFMSDRSGDHEIYMMKIDGSDLVRLTYSGGLDWYPSVR